MALGGDGGCYGTPQDNFPGTDRVRTCRPVFSILFKYWVKTLIGPPASARGSNGGPGGKWLPAGRAHGPGALGRCARGSREPKRVYTRGDLGEDWHVGCAHGSAGRSDPRFHRAVDRAVRRADLIKPLGHDAHCIAAHGAAALEVARHLGIGIALRAAQLWRLFPALAPCGVEQRIRVAGIGRPIGLAAELGSLASVEGGVDCVGFGLVHGLDPGARSCVPKSCTRSI